MYAIQGEKIISVLIVLLGLFAVQDISAQIEAEAQCVGVTTSEEYRINITGIPATAHDIILNGSVIANTNTGSFLINNLTYVDGTVTNTVEVVEDGTTDTTRILVHEVLCVDVDGDGNFDFNAAVCDYTNSNGSNGAIVSTVAPYNGENVYLYILAGSDSLYAASSLSNNSGLFENLEDGDYSVFAFNFLSKAEADSFLGSIPIGTNLGAYTPPGGPTCYALCGSADYTVECATEIDIYVDVEDAEICANSDTSFFIQDSIVAPVPPGGVLTYRWEVDDMTGGGYMDVASATDSVLTLTDVPFSDSGNVYRLIVTLTVGTDTLDMDTSSLATLSVLPHATETLDETICSDEVYTFGGTDYSTDGTYVDTLFGLAANGCDSIVTLNLTVTPKPADEVTTVTVCSDELPYVWNGTDYNASTMDTIFATDCTADSILNLTVTQKPADNVTNAEICQGDAYVWSANGETYTTAQSGLRITNGGCTADDVLNLTISTAAVLELDEAVTACSSEKIDLSEIGASISGAVTGGTWTTTGNGDFEDADENESNAFGTAAFYVLDDDDIEAGEITITLTSDDPSGPCPAVLKEITVDILDIRCSTFPWDGGGE